MHTCAWLFSTRAKSRPPSLINFINELTSYRPQPSCGKVMFLHVSVILFAGGGWSGRQTPLWADIPWQTPPGRHPLGQTPLSRHTPPPPGRQIHPRGGPLQRTVRILLECILVVMINLQSALNPFKKPVIAITSFKFCGVLCFLRRSSLFYVS